jgi:hypothetical protein
MQNTVHIRRTSPYGKKPMRAIHSINIFLLSKMQSLYILIAISLQVDIDRGGGSGINYSQ